MTGLLVGRGNEAETLKRLIAALPQSSSAALVHGEAGIGKTTLVSSVLTEVSDVRVLRGACAPIAGATAYSGLDVFIDDLPSSADRARGARSPVAGRSWAFGVLRRELVGGPAAGTILLVEDVHWADRSTLDFLAYLTRNLPVSGLLVLLTWRDDETDDERLTWLGEQLRNPSLTALALSRFSLEETGRQLHKLGCAPSVAEAIHRRSAGNPYLNVELAATASEVSSSLRHVLRARLNRVTSPGRAVVAATASLARRLTDDELLAAAGGDDATVRDVVAAGLLIRDPTAGSMARHPVLAQVAYEDLLPPERRLLHSRLAHHLAESVLPSAGASALAEVAEQYRRSGDRAATLRFSFEAARAAENRFALAEAGHWFAVAAAYRDAIPHADLPDRLALAESAAHHLGSAGRLTAAITVLDEALRDREDGSELVQPLLTRSWLRMHAGETDNALQDAERARRLVPADHELLAARALVRHLLVLLPYSRISTAVDPAAAALQVAQRFGDERTAGQARIVLGFAHATLRHFDEALDELHSAMEVAVRIAEPDDIMLAAVGLSYVYGSRYHIERLLEVLRSAQDELRRLATSRHWMEDLLEANPVEALYHFGRWDEALAFERSSSAPELPILDGTFAEIHLARGELSNAAELLDRYRMFDRNDQPEWKLGWADVQAALQLHQGQTAAALGLALETAAVIHGTEVEQQASGLLLTGVEAAVAEGSSEGFDRMVELLGGAVIGLTAEAVAATIAAERAELGGTPSPALWLATAGEWETIKHPYREARARLRAAQAFLSQARAAGARARATRELGTARRLAEALGAAPLLEQIGQLAKVAHIPLDDAAAGHDQHAGSTAPFGLTERELQVLALVVAGRTNRQIGAALYMGPKTASVHVTHILQKLGVHSRVEAATVATRLGIGA